MCICRAARYIWFSLLSRFWKQKNAFPGMLPKLYCVVAAHGMPPTVFSMVFHILKSFKISWRYSLENDV